MNTWSILVVLLAAVLLAVTSGCSQQAAPEAGSSPAAPATAPVQPSAISAGMVTPGDLTARVKEAVAYARENGKETAVAAFNDPDGTFARDNMYVFAEDYNGTALAEPFEQELVGTNVRTMTDRYDVHIIRNLEETAGYGIGFVSYDYPNPKKNNAVEPRLAVVADADGTYYVGADTRAASRMVYPSTVIGPATRPYTVNQLTTFVKNGVAYARADGKEKALLAFNDPDGQFADGEMTMIAADYNGTVLANSISPQTADDHINLINYQDPDGVRTIREMRDIALQGGGFSYTLAAVIKDGKTFYAPKIDYAEPVDDTYWIFSGIILPEYEQLREGNLTGITLRNHTRSDLYDLVSRAVSCAQVNGKDSTLALINDPHGQFVQGDLFVWAEDFNGTVLADPFWKEGIGNNFMDYADPYGGKTTVIGINAIRSGTGFTHAMFPDTSGNSTTPVPKLVFMKAVDDSWWIGGGIYGVEVVQ